MIYFKFEESLLKTTIVTQWGLVITAGKYISKLINTFSR